MNKMNEKIKHYFIDIPIYSQAEYICYNISFISFISFIKRKKERKKERKIGIKNIMSTKKL
jgi:ferritin